MRAGLAVHVGDAKTTADRCKADIAGLTRRCRRDEDVPTPGS
jgi:hypothetical protein